MNKPELICAISEKSNLTKKDAERALNALLDTITEAMINGEKIHLISFGTFEVKDRAPRTARNPNTREKIAIPTRRTATLRFCQGIRDAVAKSTHEL